MVFTGGNNEQIASISIGSSLDLTGFNRDIDRLRRQFQNAGEFPSIPLAANINPALSSTKLPVQNFSNLFTLDI